MPNVGLLPSSAHRSVRRVISTKNSVCLHEAVVRFGRVSCSTHVKVMLGVKGMPSRGLFNEVTGYLLACALGLECATHAAVIVMTGKQLKKIYPKIAWSEDATYPAWATATIGNITAFGYAENNAALIQDLKKWPKLLSTCLFDQWIGNTDRNMRNLVRISSGRYALIDHEYALTGPHWTQPELTDATETYFTNIIREMVYGQSPTIEQPIASAAVMNAEKWAPALTKASAELNEWWEDLAEDPADVMVAAKFLAERAKQLPEHIKSSGGLIV